MTKRYLFCGVACAFMWTGAAMAQTQPQASAAAPSATEVQQVVVTAQRRQEPLQRVPESVQVVSGDTLKKQNLNSLETLSESVPAIHVDESGAGGQLFIRGIGSGSNETFDQSVGTFVDDIYHGSAHTSGATFLDLSRVEVLKGPQTTYFGNNAIAGALNIITNKPSTDSYSGYVRALYGEYGQYATEAAVNVPISDQLAVRIAGIVDGQDGWQKNPYVGEDQPNGNDQALRVSLLWKPTDNFDAVLKVEGSQNKLNTGNVIGDCPPPAPFTASGFCADALAQKAPTGFNSDIDTSGPGQGETLSTFESVLTMNYRWRGLTLTSTTGFTGYRSNENLDGDATPENLLTFQTGETYRQFSQEFRVTSPTGGAFEYTAGAYFQIDHTNGDPGELTYGFLTPTIESIPAFAALDPYLPLAEEPVFKQDEQVYSLFGALTWNATDQFKVTGGLRQTWDVKNASLVTYYGQGTQLYGDVNPLPANLQPLAASLLGAIENSSNDETYQALQPSARLQYNFTSDKMVYFTYAYGFKAGVPVTTFAGQASPPLQPEHVNAYELGFKTEWLHHSILFNADVFLSDYTNLQVSSTYFLPSGAADSVITNAAASRSQGVEVEGQWVINKNFRLSSQVTYLDSIYLSYPNVTAPSIQQYCLANPGNATCGTLYPGGAPKLQNLSGEPTGFAPRWSGSFTGEFTTDLPDGFYFTADIIPIFSSNYYYANNGTDDPLLMQKGYVRLDTRFTLDFPNRRFALDVIGKNLTNVNIVSGGNGGTALPTSLGSVLYAREEPANVAVQIRYKW